MLRLLVGVCIAATLIGCTPTERPLTTRERTIISEAIKARMDDYLSAVQAGDLDSLADFYARDPEFSGFTDGESMNRESVLAQLRNLAESFAEYEAQWDSVEITPLDREFAIAAARFQREITDEQGAVLTDWGTVTWIWTLEDREWRLLHAQTVHYPSAAF